jgi:nitrogen fixation protein NifX
MKIAFASKDGIHINQHFGWCEKFYQYEVLKKNFALIKELDASQEFSDEVDKLSYKIETLEDSDMVYVSQIGPKASTMVQQAGIYPVKASDESKTIEETIASLQQMMVDNPPIWLQRILLKK